MREITLSKAVNEAIAEEMRRDPAAFLMGEDVAEAGTPFKVLSGLVEEFGTERVIDTPISEPGFMGMAVGAALTGSRPIVDLMFGDFLFLVMDQLCNQAAKACYMSGGKLSVPLVLRTNLGATRRSAAQHSQSLQALVAHIPGLKVALPSSAYEAKGLMKTAIRDDKAPAPAPETAPAPPAPVPPEPAPVPPAGPEDRVLASPKARRLALEEGLDLTRLAKAGHPQPFHVADLDTLRALPETAAAADAGAARRLMAHVPAAGFSEFCDWIAGETGAPADAPGLLAGLAAGALRSGAAVPEPLIVAVESSGEVRFYADPDRPWLGQTAPEESPGTPGLILRDLRRTAITGVALGTEAAPVLTLARDGEGLSQTLECGPGQLAAGAAVALLSEFAGRLEMPLRHLL